VITAGADPATAIDYARKLVELEYGRWPSGVYEAEDYLDWKSKLYRIRVRLELTGRR
jgi:N-methylhydantoinase B